MRKSSALTTFKDTATDRLVVLLRPVVKRIVKARKKRAAKSDKKSDKKRPAFLRFGIQDQIFFAKRLGMILRAGMPIMEGLHMLGSETRTRSSAYIFESLTVDVSSGQPLSTGLSKFHHIFGEFCINIVKVGEASGTLQENLDYVAEELKKKQTLKRKVIGALVYPAVIIVATIGIAVMLTVYIFPKIIPIFESVKASLPLSTRILIALSNFLGNWGLWLLGLLAALCVAFFFLMRTVPKFHLWMDILLLHTPFLGKLSQDYNLANSTRTLSLLLKSDLGVIRSMELVAASTRNHAYRRALYEAVEQIIRGKKISEQFQNSPELFPPLMTQMILVGESTGNLSTALMFLSDMYEEEIDDLTKNLTTILEPILMISMGLIVGFIAISIITPIYSITQSLNP
jgi:type IV pilus assembly protein PilC